MRKAKDYKEHATCGFCQHHGRVFTGFKENACSSCEIRQIRKLLEEVAAYVWFENEHKYRRDDEEFVRNCEHCEHADIFESRYQADGCLSGVWCKLEEPIEGPHEAPHSLSDCCEKWRRATDKTIPRQG